MIHSGRSSGRRGAVEILRSTSCERRLLRIVTTPSAASAVRSDIAGRRIGPSRRNIGRTVRFRPSILP